MQAIRNTLRNILPESGSTHAELWLDKFLSKQEVKAADSGSEGNPRTEHYKSVVRLEVPQAYRYFFKRWQCALQALGAKTPQIKVKISKATVKTRMVVGLGAESVLETSITLHHTYGVPYIPGSALKGLAASYARKYLGWKTDSNEYRTLFGDTKSAGFVVFFDALFDPDSKQENGQPLDRPVALDVITVHHPEYYQGKAAPADWDSPIPVPFVTAQGEYLLALAGPADWVDVAFHILGLALEHEGVGAKTAIGYGRMALEKIILNQEPDPGENFLQKIEKASNINQQFVDLFTEWERLDVSEDRKRDLAQLLLRKAEEANLPKSWTKKAQKGKTRKKALHNLERYRILLEAAGREPLA